MSEREGVSERGEERERGGRRTESRRRTQCSISETHSAPSSVSPSPPGWLRNSSSGCNVISLLRDCAVDGLYVLLLVCSDSCGSGRLLYAHLRTRTVSRWMSGLPRCAGLCGGSERSAHVDGCSAQIGFTGTGLSSRITSQPAWLCQTPRAPPEPGSPTPAS